jgi:hypothetical protein
MTSEEIAALAITLQAHTPAHILSSMELRTVLEFLKGRGYLRSPPGAAVCRRCAQATQQEAP